MVPGVKEGGELRGEGDALEPEAVPLGAKAPHLGFELAVALLEVQNQFGRHAEQ
jgi:hypothetical protein